MRGHIVKRGSSWRVMIYLGRDQTGQKQQHTKTFPTKAAAETYRMGCLSRVLTGTDLPTAPSRMRLGEYWTKWLDSEPVQSRAPTTQDIYGYCVGHLRRGLGNVLLVELDARRIDAFFGGLRRQKLSGATRHQIFRVLKTSLTAARKWKLRSDNPATDATPPTVEKRKATFWDEEQMRLFLGAAKPTTYYRLYLVLYYGGLRPGEALGLRWTDVLWSRSAVVIMQKFFRRGKRKDGELFGPTKTHRQTLVHLPAHVFDELRALEVEQQQDRKRWREDYVDHGLVFCQPNGEPLYEENINGRAFKAVVRKAKLPMMRLYDLRHCHATHLADAGVPVHLVGQRLGHSKPTTTLAYYLHPNADADRAAVEALAGRLGGRE